MRRQRERFLARWTEGIFWLKVFKPFLQSHLQTSLTKNSEACDREEKNKYNTRVIQIGSFSPLVFTPYGGSRRETDLFTTFLCGKLANKMGIDYSKVVDWSRSKLSFTLLRSSFLCIRGSRDWLRVTNQVEVKNLLKIFNWYFVYVILFTITTPYIGLAGLAMP